MSDETVTERFLLEQIAKLRRDLKELQEMHAEDDRSPGERVRDGMASIYIKTPLTKPAPKPEADPRFESMKSIYVEGRRGG
jgi:hypothetical protein